MIHGRRKIRGGRKGAREGLDNGRKGRIWYWDRIEDGGESLAKKKGC